MRTPEQFASGIRYSHPDYSAGLRGEIRDHNTNIIRQAMRQAREEILEELAQEEERECSCGQFGCIPAARAKRFRELKNKES